MATTLPALGAQVVVEKGAPNEVTGTVIGHAFMTGNLSGVGVLHPAVIVALQAKHRGFIENRQFYVSTIVVHIENIEVI